MKFKIANMPYVCKAWENNTGNQNLVDSKGPLMTTRTEYIGINYHWFGLIIQPKKIDVHMIDTDIQKANIFTKWLTRFNFESVIFLSWVGDN